ncbi:UNVERIFIED_CONTAM: DHA1 family multidrug resistance protein B-like MFS transporter [Brevibacillus sp. OAP136]
MAFKHYHRNVKIRMYDVFINSLCSMLYLPFMGIYFADHFGAQMTGIVMIATVIAGFGTGLYGSYYADLIGRKTIMVISAAVRLAAVAAVLLVNTPWFQSSFITLIAVIILSACSGVSEPVSEAMVIDVTTVENRKSVYNFLYWFRNLSQVIGGVVGGFLFKEHLTLLLLLSAALSLASFILIAGWITDTYVRPEKGGGGVNALKDLFARYKRVSSDTTFMIFTLATLLFFSLEFQLTNYIGIRLERELPDQQIQLWDGLGFSLDGVKLLGFLQAENTFLVVSATLLIVALMRRFRDTNVLFAGLIMYTIAYVFMGWSSAPLVLLVAMFFATTGEIMFWPVRQAYLAQLIPDDARSSYMAVNSLVFQGARIIASVCITAGTVVSSVIMGIFFGTIGLISILLFFQVIHRLNRNRQQKLSA